MRPVVMEIRRLSLKARSRQSPSRHYQLKPQPRSPPLSQSRPRPALRDEGVSEADLAPASEDDDTNQRRRNDSAEEPVAEPVATEAIPDEAIAALESAGTTDVYLPPAPPLPMPPSQAFLPITPTPVSDGTPTPEAETQADAPQLADNWSDESDLTALAPEAPQATDAAVADVTAAE